MKPGYSGKQRPTWGQVKALEAEIAQLKEALAKMGKAS